MSTTPKPKCQIVREYAVVLCREVGEPTWAIGTFPTKKEAEAYIARMRKKGLIQ